MVLLAPFAYREECRVGNRRAELGDWITKAMLIRITGLAKPWAVRLAKTSLG